MNNLTKEQKQSILDSFGEIVIKNVRDKGLEYSMGIAKNTINNPVTMKPYSALSNLSYEQQEAVCDLLSETITNVVYDFLEMFEENDDKMELIICKNGNRYNMCQISEKMGSEIACYEDNGWIQKFSEIGRFVL